MKDETLDFVKKFKKVVEGVKYTGSNSEIIKDFCSLNLEKCDEEIINNKKCLSLYFKSKEPFEHHYWYNLNINDYIIYNGKNYSVMPETIIKEEGWNEYK